MHPSINDTIKTPDFLAESQSGYRFYIEASVATSESTERAAARARMNTVYDVLDRLVKSPNFFLYLKVNGAPATQPSANKLATFVNDQLASLNSDEVVKRYELHGINGLPRWHFEHNGWKIEIRPIPKKPKSRGKSGVRPIGVRRTSFQRVDHRTPLRDSIKSKASRYGKLDLPYIIAVNAKEWVDEIDIMDALFGQEHYLFSFSDEIADKPEPEMSRVPNGVWTDRNGPRYTRVSAVLVVTHLSPSNIPRAILRLYHNPWAQKPYHSDLCRMPQAILENGRMSSVDGVSTGVIFGLSQSWPESAA